MSVACENKDTCTYYGSQRERARIQAKYLFDRSGKPDEPVTVNFRCANSEYCSQSGSVTYPKPEAQ